MGVFDKFKKILFDEEIEEDFDDFSEEIEEVEGDEL